MTKAYIFDQDGTLYPKKCKLTGALRERTKQWISESLGIEREEVDRLYFRLPQQYPHPFHGFRSLGLSPADYHKEVFDRIEPSDYLDKDERLIDLFKRIQDLKFIVTFASPKYSKKLIHALGINALIVQAIYAIDFPPDYSKISAYESIRSKLGLDSHNVCVIGDNFVTDVLPAIENGYRGILIGSNDIPDRRIDCMDNIYQLRIGQNLTLEDGTNIWYHKMDGKRGFIPFVFIHGNTQNHTTATATLACLNESGHPVVVYDLHGHGKSETYKDGRYTVERFSETLSKVIATSNVEKPILLGHSMGGMIALQYATENPDKIRGLILVDTADIDPVVVNKVSPLEKIVSEIVKEAYHKFKPSLSESVFPYDKKSGLSEDEIQEIGLEHTIPKALDGNFQATRKFDVRDKMGCLKVPVLIIRGEEDSFMTAEMNSEMHRRLTYSRLVTIKGYGHNFLIQRPDLLVETIKANYDFITGNASS